MVELGRVFWLRTDKPNAQGYCPVSLRLTVRGCRPAELGTGVKCRPADWAGPAGKGSPLKRSHPEYAADAGALETLRQHAKTAKTRLEALGLAVTPQAVAALLRNPAALQPGPAPCLLEWFTREVETHYRPANRATYEAVRAVVGKLRAWHGAHRLPVAALPPARAQAFYRHLLAASARGGEVATANKAVAWASALYRRGARQHVWPAADNPFPAIDKRPAPKRPKVRLTADELRRLEALPLDPRHFNFLARAVYLLQFYLRGERIGAVLLLRWANVQQQDARLRYRAQKHGPCKDVALTPALWALLDPYLPRRLWGRQFLLPLLPETYDRLDAEQQLKCIKDSTSRINKELKKLAAWAEIDKPLRSHAARHTFAKLAEKTVGARAVQQFLGHTTLKMTEIYLGEMETDELDAAAAAAFGNL